MKLKTTIKIMACASVLLSSFAWSQQKSTCYVINKDVIGTGGVTKVIVGTGGSPNEVIGVGGSPNDIIGTGGIATYCTKEIIGIGG